MDKKLLFFVSIVDLDLVAEAALSGNSSGQAVKSRKELAGLYAGIDLKINFISFFKLLEILA